MGNVDKEPLLSDLLFSIDMERQHDEVSALLDNLPPDELESSLSNIDLNLFLGENGADIPDFLAEDGISLSSCDSDEFKNFFNVKKTLKTEPVSPRKKTIKTEKTSPGKKIIKTEKASPGKKIIKTELVSPTKKTVKTEPVSPIKKNIKTEPFSPEKRNKNVSWNRRNCNISREFFDGNSKEELSDMSNERNKKVEDIKRQEVSSNPQNDKGLINNAYKKKGRKRKNSEFSKRNTKPNKNIKLVIKYKENPSEEPKAVVVTASANSTSADSSSPCSDNIYSSSFPLGFSFADIPDSFSTSIAEKVKTRTRNKNFFSEPIENNIVEDKKPVSETTVKKIKKSPVALDKSASLKSNTVCLSPRSVSYHRNKTKEFFQKNLRPIKELAASNIKSNNVLNSCNNVPSLSLIPCDDVLGITDSFVNKNKKTVINNNVIASEIKNFHDYSKSIPVNNKSVKMGKESFQNSLSIVPNECKSITLRSDTNHTSTKLKVRRTSGEYIELVPNAQESSDVPVSMAEVEIASFEDASEFSTDNKSPYSLRNSDSSPKKPIVLLTPIGSKRLLNSENLRNRHCSTESENSSRGYHSADSLSPSPAQTHNVFARLRRSGTKSNFEHNSQSDFMCNSKINSLRDKLDCDVPKDGNYDSFQSSQAKTKRISMLLESPKKDAYSSNAIFTLRPSTRSQTKSPESHNQHNFNTKLIRESRWHSQDDKKEGNDVRKLPFDNRKAIEERRVMYVGKIPNGFTEEILLERFRIFGEIENIQIKVRESEAQNDCGSVVDHEYGDWNLMSSSNGIDRWKKMYGFITFRKHADVARAIEEGQKWWPELKLNFGGRREFVKVNYSDLDGNFAERTGYAPKKDDFDFARELKAAQLRRGLAYK